MSRALITESNLTAIGDAIRAKLGTEDAYTPPEMASAIASIPTGSTPTGTITITQNGTVDVTDYASANVNVQPNLQSKTVTQNGTVTPDTGYDGLSSVVVNVSSGGGGGAGIPLNLMGQAFISSAHTVSWTNDSFPAYQQFWLDLQPYQGVPLTIVNTGSRNIYGFTSVEPYDGLPLNANRADSGGSLTVTYDGGANRYLIYDFASTFAGGCVTVSIGGNV